MSLTENFGAFFFDWRFLIVGMFWVEIVFKDKCQESNDYTLPTNETLAENNRWETEKNRNCDYDPCRNQNKFLKFGQGIVHQDQCATTAARFWRASAFGAWRLKIQWEAKHSLCGHWMHGLSPTLELAAFHPCWNKNIICSHTNIT